MLHELKGFLYVRELNVFKRHGHIHRVATQLVNDNPASVPQRRNSLNSGSLAGRLQIPRAWVIIRLALSTSTVNIAQRPLKSSLTKDQIEVAPRAQADP